MPDKYSRSFLLAYAVILLLALSAISRAPAETLPLKHFTTSDGLAHDRVNRIVRDSRGFLWFCTGEGLSRFDGYQFKNYTRDDGLPHRTIYDLVETPEGNYWVATGDGLVLFNPQGTARRWRDFETKATPSDESLMFRAFHPQEVSGQKTVWSISRLHVDDTGTVWAAGARGLYRADKVGRDWKVQDANRQEWGDRYDFETVLKDRSGALWVAGTGGIYRILSSGKVQTVSRDLSIISLFEDRAGNVWAGTRGEREGGLHQFAYRGLEEPQLLHTFTTKDGLPADFWLNDLLETSDGTFWVAALTGLCERVKLADSGLPAFKRIWFASVIAMEEDIGGNLWMGTESSGAVRLSRKGFETFEEKDGLRSPRITSIVNGPEGEVFIIALTKFIHRFDGGKFTAVSPKGIIATSWGTHQINFQDHAGEWWIAGTKGLQRYPKANRLEELAHLKPRLYTVKDGLVDNFIFRLFEDSHGDVWIGTLSSPDGNLARWERSSDQIHNYTPKDGALKNNSPTAFAEDHFGNVWIGHYDGGLVRYHNGIFQAFTEADGLPPGYIREIYPDSAGRVWIASSTSGMARIDEPNAAQPKMVSVSTAEGLSSNQITCITEDKFGRIYVGTGRGVNRLDTQTGRVKLFTTADGLPENLVNVCKRDQSGALWFGFNHGISRFIPEADAPPVPPPIFISDVIVNGTNFRKLSELGNAVVENLALASDQRQIQINFFALGFSTGETLRYQYKLDNTDWSELSAQRTVNLSLSPGSYRFLVRAVNAEGVSSQVAAVVSFAIARPVWQRWWFLSLVALMVGGIAYATHRYRMAQLLKVERVRTRIATDLHDDIGASLSRMAILSEVVKQQTAGGNGDQSVGLLSEIADSARGLVDSMSDIVWSIDPRRDDLQSLVRRIRQFASDVLEARGIDWELRVPPEVESLKLDPDKRQHLFLILKESINNIARHGEGTKTVSVSINVEGRQLIAEIKDDGCGFTPKEPDDARSEGRGGNGLPNMRERATQLGGRLDIASSPGAGTRLKLQVPIK
jgi:signal transduction histidine kinase/ligand-binding sensor domain-containing protein